MVRRAWPWSSPSWSWRPGFSDLVRRDSGSSNWPTTSARTAWSRQPTRMFTMKMRDRLFSPPGARRRLVFGAYGGAFPPPSRISQEPLPSSREAGSQGSASLYPINLPAPAKDTVGAGELRYLRHEVPGQPRASPRARRGTGTPPGQPRVRPHLHGAHGADALGRRPRMARCPADRLRTAVARPGHIGPPLRAGRVRRLEGVPPGGWRGRSLPAGRTRRPFPAVGAAAGLT